MEIVLNRNQIDHISQLITKRGVKYYDVNMELTDHIASEVEELLNENNVEYDLAVKEVFSKYDRFHFMKIEKEKKKELKKRARKIFRESFMKFFTFPKLVTTAFIYILIFSLLQYFSLKSLFYVITIIFGLFSSIFLELKKRKLLGRKSFIYIQTLLPSNCAIISLLPFLISDLFHLFTYGFQNQQYLMTCILTSQVLFWLVFLEIYNDRLNMLKMQYVK